MRIVAAGGWARGWAQGASILLRAGSERPWQHAGVALWATALPHGVQGGRPWVGRWVGVGEVLAAISCY